MERTKKGSLKKTVITGLALLVVIVMVSGEKPGRGVERKWLLRFAG